VVGGLIALVVVFAVASAAGFAMRHRQGRFRATPTAAADSAGPVVLSEADLGAPLGPQATVVQFSTEVCAYCGPARRLLTELTAQRDGVAFVEIDAAERMDLTKRLHVLSTPTVLMLDALGGVSSRSSGPQRKADVVAALDEVLASAPGRVTS
jgi:glutaredoxin